MSDPMADILAGKSGGGTSQIAELIKNSNANARNLDNITGTLRVIASDRASLIPSGVVYTPLSVTLDAGLATSFLCFLTRSDQPGKVFMVPYLECIGAVGSLQARLNASANVFQGGIRFQAECASDYISPPTLTFYYYMVQMPANAAAT